MRVRLRNLGVIASNQVGKVGPLVYGALVDLLSLRYPQVNRELALGQCHAKSHLQTMEIPDQRTQVVRVDINKAG